MHKVTVHQAKTNLSGLLREAQNGEEVVISRGKTPIARLVPLASARIRRVIGTAPDLIRRMDKDFNAPLADFKPYL